MMTVCGALSRPPSRPFAVNDTSGSVWAGVRAGDLVRVLTRFAHGMPEERAKEFPYTREWELAIFLRRKRGRPKFRTLSIRGTEVEFDHQSGKVVTLEPAGLWLFDSLAVEVVSSVEDANG